MKTVNIIKIVLILIALFGAPSFGYDVGPSPKSNPLFYPMIDEIEEEEMQNSSGPSKTVSFWTQETEDMLTGEKSMHYYIGDREVSKSEFYRRARGLTVRKPLDNTNEVSGEKASNTNQSARLSFVWLTSLLVLLGIVWFGFKDYIRLTIAILENALGKKIHCSVLLGILAFVGLIFTIRPNLLYLTLVFAVSFFLIRYSRPILKKLKKHY